MTDACSREPNGSPKKPDPTTMFARQTCPNCGRGVAVVFPLIRQGEKPLLVCLACCPRDDSDA